MSLERVYASKLYRVNKNKDSIKSAFENPINSQLVQQLFNQVDDKYKKLDDIDNEHAEPQTSESADRQNDNSASLSVNRHFSSPMNFESAPHATDGLSDSGNGSYDSTFNGDLSDSGNGSDTDAANDDVDDNTSDKDNHNTEDDISESAKISGDSVNAAKALYTNAEKTHDFKSDCDIIKGTLNSRQDTSGVIRTTVKDSEMWLYYNDSINLNTVMAQVIDFVSGAGYNYLEFNRLARSDNAIVFEINPDIAQEVSKEHEKE